MSQQSNPLNEAARAATSPGLPGAVGAQQQQAEHSAAVLAEYAPHEFDSLDVPDDIKALFKHIGVQRATEQRPAHAHPHTRSSQLAPATMHALSHH